MQTVEVPELVQPQGVEAMGVLAPAPARGVRWWAVVPLAVAGFIAMSAVPALIDIAASGRPTETALGRSGQADAIAGKSVGAAGVETERHVEAERFVDPEGLYTIQTGPDWEPLTPYNTGEERFAVSEPVGGYTPEVIVGSGPDSFGDAEQEARFYAEFLSGDGYDILDTGAVEGTDGALGFLEWRDPDGARGYTVVATGARSSAMIQVLAPPRAYEEILEDVKPLLHTLRPTD